MAGEIVTSCPLCLALSDPGDMIDVEIDRVVPRGRAHVLLCRRCGSAVVRAMAKAGEPLAKELIELDQREAESPASSSPVVQEPTGSSAQGADTGVGTISPNLKPEEPNDGQSGA